MMRLFRRIGWEPNILAQTPVEEGALCLGLWDVSSLALRHMAERQMEGSKNPLALSCFFGVDWGWWKMKQPGFF
ncbi:hypothetical protein, partial [Acetobacter pasteurianus]